MARELLEHPNDIDLFTAGLAKIDTSLVNNQLKKIKQPEPSSALCTNENLSDHETTRNQSSRRRLVDHVGAFNLCLKLLHLIDDWWPQYVPYQIINIRLCQWVLMIVMME